ncbi:hypothetical protein H0H81_007555 [Sphagnurus paluster]|uniref:Uncharacterized protein n=1 Tax=Sphagnurus paluster TaxID=117069 RepID=A0A9P7K4Y2_9AGAR|nr:hypothetical protein H0H81_007555 [Sphagnurus paluster]
MPRIGTCEGWEPNLLECSLVELEDPFAEKIEVDNIGKSNDWDNMLGLDSKPKLEQPTFQVFE